MTKGGKSPKRKGDQSEREFCKLMGGERTYWQPGQKRKPDVINVPYVGAGEIKRRKDGFKQLYAWLATNDFVAVRADRRPWLIVLRAEDVKMLIEDMGKIKMALSQAETAKI